MDGPPVCWRVSTHWYRSRVEVREGLERRERDFLAPHATRSAESKGRDRAEAPDPFRTAFQVDRDRILGSKAFRRLVGKTQVFLMPTGDHYRNRLTHTIEVARIGRTIARALALNEDLAEAVCLGHDLGHTPFGHLGETAMSAFCGQPWKHADHSLRIVERLEREGAGLNLTWETRDGIVGSTWSQPTPATPEAMCCRFADRFAYLAHDVDDAVRAGVIAADDLPSAARRAFGTEPEAMVDAFVADVVHASAGRDTGEVRMSDAGFVALGELRQFMFARVYEPSVGEPQQARVVFVLRSLLDYFASNPAELPGGEPAPHKVGQCAVDYVAGMTDRYALRRFAELLLPETSV